MRRYSAARPQADEWAASKGKALVVDADADSLRSLKSLLNSLGQAVAVAGDADSAAVAFVREAPDLVLMDVATMGSQLFAAVRRIKALAGDRLVPVIFLTTQEEEEKLEARAETGGDSFLDLGGDDFLSKPVSRAHLRAKLAAFARVAQLYRMVQDQQHELVYEQELAKQVYAKTAMADPSQLAVIRSLQRPASVFSGDILLLERSPSGALHVLVGDFTGHGLAAAIGALPAADVFRGMTAKGFTPSEILTEINRKLRQTLPTGMFLAAVLVCLDQEGRWAGIRNSGLPDVLVLGRDGGAPKRRLPSSSLPLGIADYVEPAKLEWIEVDPGDQIAVVTDGIVEARNPAGEFFGDERLSACLAGGGSGDAFQRLVRSVDEFIGGAPQEDDLTLAVIPCGLHSLWPEAAGRKMRGRGARNSERGGGAETADWRWELELRPAALKRLDAVPLLVDTVVHLQGLREHRQALFTILAELFNNALDHGVLRLESGVKDSPEGFARYFKERHDRLARLERGRILVGFSARLQSGGGWLEIHIEDDGPGFDYERWKQELDQALTFSGRGIGLVRALCETLGYEGAGNVAKAVYRW
jgi:serine phosphatase RsbU (regulator of sigma subunit)